MWDIPIERRIQKKLAEQAYGNVLIVGYGLGLIQEYLTKNPKVKSILTIKKFEDTIKLSKKIYGRIYGPVQIKDFYKYQTSKKFDCIIGDIWPDILPEYLKEYKMFKKKAEKLLKPAGKILS